MTLNIIIYLCIYLYLATTLACSMNKNLPAVKQGAHQQRRPFVGICGWIVVPGNMNILGHNL